MIKVSRKEFLLIPLLILFACEVVAITNFKFLHFDMATASWLFLISGLLIAILPFLILVNDNSKPWGSQKWDHFVSQIVFAAAFIGFTCLIIFNTIENLAD